LFTKFIRKKVLKILKHLAKFWTIRKRDVIWDTVYSWFTTNKQRWGSRGLWEQLENNKSWSWFWPRRLGL